MAVLIDERSPAAPPPMLSRHLHRLDALVDDLPAVDGLTGEQVLGDLSIVDRVITRLQARRLDLIMAADRQALADREALTGTSAWISRHSRTGGARGAADTRLARQLDAHPSVRAALQRGDLSVDHASVVTTAMDRLPDHLSPTDRAVIESALIDKASRLDPPALRREGRRILATVEAPSEEVDAHEDEVLRNEEAEALAKTRLTLHDNHDGTISGHFTVPTPAGDILTKAIQQIASPRRHRQQAEREGLRGVAAFAETDWSHLRGLALVELLEHLPTDHLNGKVAATVVVTIGLDHLVRGTGAARTDTGHPMSAGQARRAACNAGILPVVLDGDSLPLDLGRTRRFFTEHQRTALASRYCTCAASGCDRPFAWTELHHEDPWSRSGETNLDRAIPLCGHHHRLIHRSDRPHRVHTAREGTKTVTFHRRT